MPYVFQPPNNWYQRGSTHSQMARSQSSVSMSPLRKSPSLSRIPPMDQPHALNAFNSTYFGLPKSKSCAKLPPMPRSQERDELDKFIHGDTGPPSGRAHAEPALRAHAREPCAHHLRTPTLDVHVCCAQWTAC